MLMTSIGHKLDINATKTRFLASKGQKTDKNWTNNEQKKANGPWPT